MTVIEAMQQTRDENGNIVIPVAAMLGEEPVVGTVTEEWLRSEDGFGILMDMPLPLSEAQFDELKRHKDGQWSSNWQWYRDNHVVSVLD